MVIGWQPTPVLPGGTDGAWGRTFEAFSPAHAVVVAVLLAATAAAVGLSLWWRAHPRRRAALDRGLAVVALLGWPVFVGWWMVPGRFDPQHSWPLQLCDLAGLVAPIALLTGARWARALLHYWGLGLATQAIITPALAHGPATAEFWTFWLSHGLLVGLALYDFLARGFRPTWRDCGIGLAAGLVYLAVVLPLDVAFGLNYGYLGNAPRPENPTILDQLGPWPLRVVWIVLLTEGLVFGMTWPWELARWVRRRRRRGAETGDTKATAARAPGAPRP